MREWKIICDHCGVEISGNPFQSVIEHVGRETDAPVINQKETFTLDLCEACVDELRSWKLAHVNTGVLPEKEDKPDPAELAEQIVNELFKDAPESADPEEAPEDTAPPKSRKIQSKVDLGKIIALKKAGWTYKQIADEMKLTEKQVGNYLYNAKKRGQI